MNNIFFLQQRFRTGNVDSNLISRQHKLNLMGDFLRIKYKKPKLKQSEIANQLSYSSSTLQKYKKDINLLSKNSIQPNNINKPTKSALNTNFNNNSHRELDVKKLQMTSKDLKTIQTLKSQIRKTLTF